MGTCHVSFQVERRLAQRAVLAPEEGVRARISSLIDPLSRLQTPYQLLEV